MTTLREQLSSHLDATVPPPPDLPAVLARGRRLRRRRAGGVASGALVAVAAVVAVAVTMSRPAGPGLPTFVGHGEVDLAGGLRAYAMPGRDLHLAGRTFPDTFPDLDTDAAATPLGIVSYDHGLPVLLEPSGSTVLLDRGPTDDVSGFHPTVRADAARPLVAYAFLVDGVVTVKVYDLDRRRVVAASTVPCREGCSDVSVDGLDSGTVFVSNHDGTRAWDYRSDQWSLVAGRGTVVADVRNRVVLYAGDPPTSPVDGWRWVHGAIDAQLSFDGRYVLDWSSVLEPTDPAGRPVTLAEGPRRPGYAFFAFDTDGSVLVSVGPRTSGEDFPVYDCPLSGEPCDELAPLPPGGGDPLFIGHDI